VIRFVDKQFFNRYIKVGLFFHFPDNTLFRSLAGFHSSSRDDPVGPGPIVCAMLDEENLLISHDQALVASMAICH
jgi:hypothetical protein